MRTYSRSDRVAGLIKEALSDLLKKKIKDPYLQMAIITEIKMSADLKRARVYFVSSGGKVSVKDALKGFTRASGYMKKLLSREVTLRYMPELTFFHDDSFDYGTKIDRLLASIEKGDDPDSSIT
jgi:ribosome-binding factor A